jgi:hypothetical protein
MRLHFNPDVPEHWTAETDDGEYAYAAAHAADATAGLCEILQSALYKAGKPALTAEDLMVIEDALRAHRAEHNSQKPKGEPAWPSAFVLATEAWQRDQQRIETAERNVHKLRAEL